MKEVLWTEGQQILLLPHHTLPIHPGVNCGPSLSNYFPTCLPVQRLSYSGRQTIPDTALKLQEKRDGGQMHSCTRILRYLPQSSGRFLGRLNANYSRQRSIYLRTLYRMVFSLLYFTSMLSLGVSWNLILKKLLAAKPLTQVQLQGSLP